MDDENTTARNLVVLVALTAGSLYYLNRRYRRVDPANEIVHDEDEADVSPPQVLIRRGQRLLEETLDNLSEQAMAEVKVILKNAIHRLEQAIDDL